MKLHEKIKTKYLARFDELIEKGEKVPIHHKSEARSRSSVTGQVSYRLVEEVDWPKFVEWRTNCVTLLEQVVPQDSSHRSTVNSFHRLSNSPSKLQFGLSFLKSLREDIEKEYLQGLASEIDAEITGDLMGQAESLLNEGTTGRFDHVPAAVLAGAILEKSLKTICGQLSPPEETRSQNGSPLRLNALIDALKKRKVYNELRAKELRPWAEIRNHAAHGNFDEFNRAQVESMISGIRTFLMQDL